MTQNIDSKTVKNKLSNAKDFKKKSKRAFNSRSFCLTTFKTENYEEWKHVDIKKHKIKYLVYQQEICPETKKPHIQGYVEFVNQRTTMKTIKKIFNDNTLHIEVRRGTQTEARDYCMKAESQDKDPIELGKFVTSGRRTDIEQMYQSLKEGKSPTEIMDLYPSMYVKYHKAIDRCYNNLHQKEEGKYKDIQVNVLYGVAGSGKTRHVYDTEGTENVYRLTKSNSNNIWFDGYQNQKVLLIDDYYGWIKYGKLLELLDGYCQQLENKGGYTYSKWDKIYITSNVHPSKWYKKGLTEALARRINYIDQYVIKDKSQISKPIERKFMVDNGIKTLVKMERSNKGCCIVLPTTYEEKVCSEDSTEKRTLNITDMKTVQDTKTQAKEDKLDEIYKSFFTEISLTGIKPNEDSQIYDSDDESDTGENDQED